MQHTWKKWKCRHQRKKNNTLDWGPPDSICQYNFTQYANSSLFLFFFCLLFKAIGSTRDVFCRLYVLKCVCWGKAVDVCLLNNSPALSVRNLYSFQAVAVSRTSSWLRNKSLNCSRLLKGLYGVIKSHWMTTFQWWAVHFLPIPSVTAYLVQCKWIHIILPKIWHSSSRILRVSHLHITSPSFGDSVKQNMVSR